MLHTPSGFGPARGRTRRRLSGCGAALVLLVASGSSAAEAPPLSGAELRSEAAAAEDALSADDRLERARRMLDRGERDGARREFGAIAQRHPDDPAGAEAARWAGLLTQLGALEQQVQRLQAELANVRKAFEELDQIQKKIEPDEPPENRPRH
jgi:hypothetical protein